MLTTQFERGRKREMTEWSLRENVDPLEHAEAILRYRFRRMNNREDFEDGIQEALIRLWNARSEGKSDTHAIRLAQIYAKSFWFGDTNMSTGHQRISRDGVTSRSATAEREKVMSFRGEFYTLHDRLPTTREVSQATGVRERQVRKYVAAAKQGFAITGRVHSKTIDRNNTSMDVIMSAGHDFSGGGFEDDFVSETAMIHLLSSMRPNQAEVLYLTYWLGWPQKQIAQHLGVGQPVIGKRLAKARENFKSLYEESR